MYEEHEEHAVVLPDAHLAYALVLPAVRPAYLLALFVTCFIWHAYLC